MRVEISLTDWTVKTCLEEGLLGKGVLPWSAQSRGMRVWLLSGSSIT